MAKYIKYIGTSHVREITDKQWSELDPPVDQRTIRWHAGNAWTVPTSYITDDAWPYIDADPELIVVDRDAPKGKSENDVQEIAVTGFPPLTTANEADTFTVTEVDTDTPDQQSGGVDQAAETQA
jgi:hypothetical protein